MKAVNITPNSIEEFQKQVLRAGTDNRPLALTGSGSKTQRRGNGNAMVVSTSSYCGIIDHQASDFTITVRSGTPVREVVQALNEAGQYLPFDPVFVKQGATVGGMIAAGINGPCRLRYGGIRDFLIGCHFLDGRGSYIRSGGKVVKNAAGFDLPKFFVGSAGRFGLILEATFKVFPRPRFFRTATCEKSSIQDALKLLQRMIATKLDFEALEISETNQVTARWSADSEDALQIQSESLGQQIAISNLDSLSGPQEDQYWQNVANFDSLDFDSLVVKVPLARNRILGFDAKMKPLDINRRFSVQGTLAYLFLPSADLLPAIHATLFELGLTGQVVVGDARRFLIGSARQMPFLKRVKSALDPNGIFRSLATDVPEVRR